MAAVLRWTGAPLTSLQRHQGCHGCVVVQAEALKLLPGGVVAGRADHGERPLHRAVADPLHALQALQRGVQGGGRGAC